MAKTNEGFCTLAVLTASSFILANYESRQFLCLFSISAQVWLQVVCWRKKKKIRWLNKKKKNLLPIIIGRIKQKCILSRVPC